VVGEAEDRVRRLDVAIPKSGSVRDAAWLARRKIACGVWTSPARKAGRFETLRVVEAEDRVRRLDRAKRWAG